jgi:hypothetical protein
MVTNSTEMFRPLNEPGPRFEPLIDNFEAMSEDEKDKIYSYSLCRATEDGVRALEKAIRNKINQKTSGGPFALRKAFKVTLLPLCAASPWTLP